LQQKKIFYKDNLHHFSPGERRLINPHYYKVDISDALYDVKMSIIGKLVKEIEEFEL
jgi:nicotinate phosphoribosyltransferase